MSRIQPRHLILALFFLCMGLATSWSSLRLRSLYTQWREPDVSAVEKWNPRLFQLLSFGHLPLAIDWLWIRSLQDAETNRVKAGEHAPTFYYLDLATDLDPAFFDVYYSGGNFLAIIRGDIEGAKTLLLKGEKFRKTVLPSLPQDFREKFWPHEWQLPMLLAYVYLFELNDMTHASTYFVDAAALPDSPEYLKRLSIRFEQPGGVYEVGIRVLNFMINTQHDPLIREQLAKKRQSLFISQYLFHLNSDFQKFLNEKPEYKSKTHISHGQLSAYWSEFVRRTKTGARDPLGGVISLSEVGKIVSSTPHESVFGLE